MVVLSLSFYLRLSSVARTLPPAPQRHWYPVSLQNQMKVPTLATTCFLHVQLQHVRVRRPSSVLSPLYSVHCRTPSCASVWLSRACECNVNDTQMGHTPPRHGLQFMAEWQMPNGQNCSQLMHTHSTTLTHSHTHTARII